MDNPVSDCAPGVHDRVLELCRGLSGSVLDAPCGEGALAKRLAGLGHTVTAIDIDEDAFKAVSSGITFKKVDLNMDLPYPDSTFDCVTCVEGVEHVEDMQHLLRQFARTLRPGGMLIITTPNITNLVSRIKFLLFGSFRYFNSKIDIGDRSLAGHIHPVTFQELEYALNIAGFSIETVTTNTDLMRWRVARSAVASISRGINRIFNKAHNEALCRRELLFGDIIILSARRGR